MFTKNEVTALSLSPTKKDFVQIWNELLEVAGKLSERWDPTSTNESDPGIVILKALTGIADKLNYNIDKNTLEAFMPTAAQEDSMRKLCDMMGYTMKYYQSAETKVNVKYYNSDPSDKELNQMALGLYIPKFTVITNSDQDINYFTINKTPLYISAEKTSVIDIPCMEGQLVKCESINSNNVITINQISENNRFYLPETQIAENGIFIYNVDIDAADSNSLADGVEWTKVDNLNTQIRGARVFKFGYDSYESRPYVEFPEDYSELFNEGLFIYYTRTSGVNGNISSRTLTQLALPSTAGWSEVAAESFGVENIYAATSGANTETIKQAYSNFKKTIGTFETLVTCRDYMNKVYSLINNGKPVVSNILVTDIRNDINRATIICSCDDAGIFYKETPRIETAKKETAINTEVTAKVEITANKPVFDAGKWYLGNVSGMELAKTKLIPGNSNNFDTAIDGEVYADNVKNCWVIKQNGVSYPTSLIAFEEVTVPVSTAVETEAAQEAITHFDLVFYPFKSYNQIKGSTKNSIKDIRAVYDASFTLLPEREVVSIANELTAAGIKTLSHNITTARKGDLVSINNYLRLSATIATNAKVTEIERDLIVDNIKVALANAFNMRELDFGDEIPFDSIVEVIETADSRIRVASLNEPALYTTFSVLETDADDKLEVIEYAVASDWLDADMAESTGRLTKTVKVEGSNGKLINKSVSTFNTKEAKQIYNRLVVRNVLAGRVPLFNYNNTFKTSFSESAYQVTTTLPINPKPGSLPEPAIDNPFTLWTENDIIYTGQLVYDKTTDRKKTVYTETRTPEVYQDIIKDNVIKETEKQTASDNATGTTTEDNNTVTDYITGIDTSCKLFTNEHNMITDVTLADGEFVKFRAPNFTTIKTYPAYVNYHLHLNENVKAEASPAVAYKLFDKLNEGVVDWTASGPDINWQKVLNYFGDLDGIHGTSYKKTFTLAQTVSAFKDAEEKPNKSEVSFSINVNGATETPEYEWGHLVNLSGCVKCINTRVEWTPVGDEHAPVGEVPVEVSGPENPFITSEAKVRELLETLDEYLSTYAIIEEGKKNLPRECSWTVYFDFECVPFEAKSLAAWEKFISTCALNYDKNYKHQVFDFKPVAENDCYLWRSTNDSGYDIGKYVTEDHSKLLKFSRNYLTSLSDIPLNDIYIIKELGKGAELMTIKNNEEYRLRQSEWLYIEYTPSTTTENGTSQKQEPVTEVYGEGTIIRPSGFDTGLTDSAVYGKDNTPVKSVVFSQVSNNPVNMFSFGASEQVEIRDLAKVTLTKDYFSGGSGIYVYKNFNNCPALQDAVFEDGTRVNNTYTLKDGEYIFYTDADKSDFAYYTSGTQVTLTGNSEMVLPEFDVIELSSIFESGIQEIPWKYKALEAGDSIEFQEYQYVTLGPGDTIKNVELVTTSSDPDEIDTRRYLDENWQYCSDVEYAVANTPDTRLSLPIINLPERTSNNSNGWEACSTLELDVTSTSAQVLRSTDKVETGLVLSRTSTVGGSANDYTITPIAGMPLSFKTNLACQACGNSVDIDQLYFNPNNVKGFQLKVFAADAPSIVTTLPGTVAPYANAKLIDFATWTGEPLATKDYQELWNKVNLDDITVTAASTNSDAFDKALRLSVSLLQDTYGIFGVYIDYAADQNTANTKVWLEAIPGTKSNDITVLNTSEAFAGLDEHNRLYLTKGLNCLRINKTCKIFIKASSNAKGILYFDEPRLVNSKKLGYLAAGSDEPVELHTNGLNLAQLGYLDTSDADETKLDEATRNKLREASIAGATAKISDTLQKVDAEIYDKYSVLVKLLPKAQALVKAEELIKEELENITGIDDTGIDDSRLKELLEKHEEVSARLANENALLDALKDNAKVDEIEQKLVALLDSLSRTESTQKQIMDELAIIKAKAIASVDSMTATDILVDYADHVALVKKADTLVATDIAGTFAKIKAVAEEGIEKNYQEQLTILVNNLVQLVNSEDKNSLFTVLEGLRANELSETNANLQALVNKLIDALEQDTINNALTEMAEAAAAPDYVRLYSLTTSLSNLVEYRGLTAIAAELAQVISDMDDSSSAQLGKLITEFTTAINAIGSTDNSTLRGKLLALADKVKAQVDTGSTTVNAQITAEVKNINNAFISEFKTKINSILTDMNACLGELNKDTPVKSIIALLEKLEYSSNQEEASRVKAIVDNIKAIITERSTYLTQLKTASYSGWDTIIDDFVKEAILVVWPSYTSDRLDKLLLDIDAAFKTTINGALDKFTENKDNFEKLFANYTDVLLEIIDKQAFIYLFDNIKVLHGIREQSKADHTLISEISGLVRNSVELTKATSSNIIIGNLISEWQNAKENRDVIRKQHVQSAIKEELIKAIAADAKMLDIVSELLYPNVKKAETELDLADDFYKKLFIEIGNIKDALLSGDISATSIAVDADFVDLLALPFADFKAKLAIFDTQNDGTLLPTDVVELADAVKKTVLNIKADTQKLKDKPVTTAISSDDLAALVEVISTEELKNILTVLAVKLQELDGKDIIEPENVGVFKTLRLEEQLLTDIRACDINKEFYYCVPVEDRLAIELNESDKKLNTLMNPLTNYDINNVNNCFVISKLDIDYLDGGIQIARSSRIN